MVGGWMELQGKRCCSTWLPNPLLAFIASCSSSSVRTRLPTSRSCRHQLDTTSGRGTLPPSMDLDSLWRVSILMRGRSLQRRSVAEMNLSAPPSYILYLYMLQGLCFCVHVVWLVMVCLKLCWSFSWIKLAFSECKLA